VGIEVRAKSHQFLVVSSNPIQQEGYAHIGSRRLISTDDVHRLAHHFKVIADWSATETGSAAPDSEEQAGLKIDLVLRSHDEPP
jgi:hypothetical protein